MHTALSPLPLHDLCVVLSWTFDIKSTSDSGGSILLVCLQVFVAGV
jgi:hypothetical protein